MLPVGKVEANIFSTIAAKLKRKVPMRKLPLRSSNILILSSIWKLKEYFIFLKFINWINTMAKLPIITPVAREYIPQILAPIKTAAIITTFIIGTIIVGIIKFPYE